MWVCVVDVFTGTSFGDARDAKKSAVEDTMGQTMLRRNVLPVRVPGAPAVTALLLLLLLLLLLCKPLAALAVVVVVVVVVVVAAVLRRLRFPPRCQ